MQEQDLHILAPPGMIHLPGRGLGGGSSGCDRYSSDRGSSSVGGLRSHRATARGLQLRPTRLLVLPSFTSLETKKKKKIMNKKIRYIIYCI